MRPSGARASARARIRVATVNSVAGCSRMSTPVAWQVVEPECQPARRTGMRPILLAVALLVSSACGGGAANRAADIAGIVTNVSGRTDGVTVLVESDPSTPSSGAKASVAVTSGTRITRRAQGGDVAATARELTPGVQVEIWFDGPAAMSYPIQAKAMAVVIVR
jgi:hypothetical protein